MRNSMRSLVVVFLVIFSGFLFGSEVVIHTPMIQEIESKLSALYDFGVSSQDYDCLLAVMAFKQSAMEDGEAFCIKPRVKEYLITFGLADENGIIKSEYLIVWKLHRGHTFMIVDPV